MPDTDLGQDPVSYGDAAHPVRQDPWEYIIAVHWGTETPPRDLVFFDHHRADHNVTLPGMHESVMMFGGNYMGGTPAICELRNVTVGGVTGDFNIPPGAGPYPFDATLEIRLSGFGPLDGTTIWTSGLLAFTSPFTGPLNLYHFGPISAPGGYILQGWWAPGGFSGPFGIGGIFLEFDLYGAV